MSAVQLTLILVAFLESATLGTLLFALFKHHQVLSDFLRCPARPPTGSKCLLIRPCSGDEPHLRECLISVVAAKCDMPLRILIGVDNTSDPAIRAAEIARSELSQKGFTAAIVQSSIQGPNRKSAIIAECIRQAGSDFEAVIVADSNVDLGGVDLNRMIARLLNEPRIGAVWVPFREGASPSAFGNVASRAVLHYSWHSFGLLSRIDPDGMVGKLFAVRKEALHTVDYFRSLVCFLGEDMALSHALRKAGYIVKSLPMVVRSPCGFKTWKDTICRHVRWILVIKAQRPALLVSYPLLMFNALLMYALCLSCIPYSSVYSFILLGTAILLRTGVGYTAARILTLRPKVRSLFFGIFIADAVLLIAFIKALWTRQFLWRGRLLRISSNGELREGDDSNRGLEDSGY